MKLGTIIVNLTKQKMKSLYSVRMQENTDQKNLGN